jgi:hypothetical protein
MTTQEKMTVDERRKYLSRMKKRYQPANRPEQGQLLTEMEQVTELHRKSLIRLLNSPLSRQPRRRERGRVYDAEVDDALRVIAESFDHICAERLTPNLGWMAEQLARHGELELSDRLSQKLGQISVSSVGRVLNRISQDQPRLPRKGPAPANQVARDIPMKRIAWDEAQPGHFETDLVHHGGPEAVGQYLHTLQLIDVATGWSERVAVLGRSYVVMADAFGRIVERLPFPIREIHPDNGSEFLNHHLIRFFRDTIKGVELSRSRPYHKNDNRFVEQKNDTLVRAYLGHDRLDSVVQTLALNRLYERMGLYYNLFQPVMRLAEKSVVTRPDQSTRLKRRHDLAQTPFDRLCATKAIASPQQLHLQQWRQQTNPRQLRREIYQALDALFALAGAVPGVTEDVYQTLATPITLPKGEDSLVTLSFE